MFETFPDNQGHTYNLNKIVRIGPSQPRGERDGVAVYEHDVWIEGTEDPIGVDWQTIEAIEELSGSLMSAQPDFFVIDFENDLSKPKLVPIIGWRVSARHFERLVPVTLNGNNNGATGRTWPILQPDGSVDDWDREFPTFSDCVASYSETRKNG